MFNGVINGLVNLFYSVLNTRSIRLTVINKNAIIPQKEQVGSAGYAVYCPDNVVILKGQRVLIPLGILIEIPDYYYVRVAPVNYLSMKGIDIGAGVINSSYFNEVKIMLVNNSDSDYFINTGDKIGQIILERCAQSKFDILCDYEDLTDSDSQISEESSESIESDEESEVSAESDELAEKVESFDNNDEESVNSFENNEYTHVM